METLANSPGTRDALGVSRRRCTATAKSTGQPCTRWAILGGYVCVVHGGGTTLVRDAAQKRLMALAEPAIAGLNMVVHDLTAEWERALGMDDAPRIAHLLMLGPQLTRAAQMVLDRCGFSPAMKLEVSQPNPFEGLSTAEIADRAEEFARQCRADADAEAQMKGEVINVEVIPNE